LIAAFFLVLGVLLMFVQWRAVPSFFRRKPEVAPAGFLEGEAALEPVPIARDPGGS